MMKERRGMKILIFKFHNNDKDSIQKKTATARIG